MTDERTALLDGLRRSLFVVQSASGRPQVRLDRITPDERRALRDALDEELEALRSRFAFDPVSDVQRGPLDVLAVVSANGGQTEVIVDPLRLLPLIAPAAIAADDPPGRRH